MRPIWLALILAASSACWTAGWAAQPDRSVLNNTVISRRDPAVEIRLPGSVRYVGADSFPLKDPTLRDVESCELYAFVGSDDTHLVRRAYWIQFEQYLPDHPELHMTYDAPRHATIGGLDFYVDVGVSHGASQPKPGSDADHFYALLASRGYQRTDRMWVRLVHLVDAAKRKELMIIYSEGLGSMGYTADQLGEGGAEHDKADAILDGLIGRAERSISIGPVKPARPPS